MTNAKELGAACTSEIVTTVLFNDTCERVGNYILEKQTMGLVDDVHLIGANCICFTAPSSIAMKVLLPHIDSVLRSRGTEAYVDIQLDFNGMEELTRYQFEGLDPQELVRVQIGMHRVSNADTLGLRYRDDEGKVVSGDDT